MTRAPRALARSPIETHGWHSAILEPWMMMQSAFAISWTGCVAPPRPNEVPKLGTVAECQIRAWFSICIAPAAV